MDCAAFFILCHRISPIFTVLNDGLTSAMIAFLRTRVFQIAAVCILPVFRGLDSIWFYIILAEYRRCW